MLRNIESSTRDQNIAVLDIDIAILNDEIYIRARKSNNKNGKYLVRLSKLREILSLDTTSSLSSLNSSVIVY